MAETPLLRVPGNASSKVKKSVCELHERLLSAGFSPVNSPLLVKQNELVYNRGISAEGRDNGKSNFCVFVKIDGNKAETLFFDPDFGPNAALLKQDQIYREMKITGFTAKGLDEVMTGITAAAEKKPLTSYFTVLHGHTGFIDNINLLENHYDDGESEQAAIVRQLMLHHYDLDFMGMHNNFVAELYHSQTKLERQAGIIKLPSVEATVPISDEGANGPHENIWFASPREALAYHQRFFKHRTGKYPPYATKSSMDEMMRHNRRLSEDGGAAFGIPHAAAASIISWLGRVSTGEWSREALEKHVREDIQGIGAFNLDISNSKLVSDNPSEMKYFIDLVRDGWKTGDKTYNNVVNMAWSQQMRKQFGTFMYADHDLHKYPDFSYGGSIQGLGKMFNVFVFDPLVVRDHKPDAREVVKLMHSPIRAERILAMIPYDAHEMDLVDARNYLTFWDRISKSVEFVGRIFKTAPEIWDEIISVIQTRYK